MLIELIKKRIARYYKIDVLRQTLNKRSQQNKRDRHVCLALEYPNKGGGGAFRSIPFCKLTVECRGRLNIMI